MSRLKSEKLNLMNVLKEAEEANVTINNDITAKLKSIAGPNDSVDDYGSRISVSFHRGDVNLYGTILKEDKATKLAVASGPNPLEPEFVELLNELSDILQGYEHLHY